MLALIITIIVMLILATVSISAIVGEDGVITKAQASGEEQRGATVEEHRDVWKSSLNVDMMGNTSNAQTLEEVVEDLKNGSLINEEEANQILDEGYVKINNKKIVFRDGNIGDYINYIYDENIEGYAINSDYKINSEPGTTYNIKQMNNLTWKILNIDDKKITIVACSPNEENYNINEHNDTILYLQGENGFTNGVFLLNDICEKLYSNKSLGLVARSINIEDLNNLSNEEKFYSLMEEVDCGGIMLPEILQYENSSSVYDSLTDFRETSLEKIKLMKSNAISTYQSSDFNDEVEGILFLGAGTYGGVNITGIATRWIEEREDENYLMGILVFRANQSIRGKDLLCYNNGEKTFGGVNINVRPIIEISLSKYKIVSKNGVTSDEHNTVDTAWEIVER